MNPSHGNQGFTKTVGEFELIAALKSVISNASTSEDLLIGIGDDAAAVKVDSELHVMTTDTMVDGVHFVRGKASWADVGWKSAVSNLSDIAAMGAKPLHALVTLGVTGDVAVSDMEELYGGMVDAFQEFGGSIVGGDVVSSPVFFVTVALTGHASSVDGVSAVLRRDTAQPGDLIGVTGTLGGSAGGLKTVLNDLTSDEFSELVRMHYRPAPRVQEAKALVESGVVCAMDVSDGLIADLEKICAASEVGASLNASSIPMPSALKAAYPEEALSLALSGGEDYELLFTAPFDLMDRIMARHRGMVTHIGSIVSEPDDGERVVVLDTLGEPIDIKKKGWDHLGAR